MAQAGSQLPGTTGPFAAHRPCCTHNHPPNPSQRCSAAGLSAPTVCILRRWTSQTLWSWRAGSCFSCISGASLDAAPSPTHCSAGITGAEAGSAPLSPPVPFHYCSDTRALLPRAVVGSTRSLCISENGATAMGRRCLLLCQLLLCMADNTSHTEPGLVEGAPACERRLELDEL